MADVTRVVIIQQFNFIFSRNASYSDEDFGFLFFSLFPYKRHESVEMINTKIIMFEKKISQNMIIFCKI